MILREPGHIQEVKEYIKRINEANASSLGWKWSPDGDVEIYMEVDDAIVPLLISPTQHVSRDLGRILLDRGLTDPDN